jgi:trimeric autotransporter adhesin
MASARLLDSARAAFALAALSLLCLTPAASANFDSLPSGPLIADGAVQAIAVSGENVYLGGSFQTIGPRTGQGVLFNSDLSSIDSSIPQVSGGERKVDAVVSDGQGGWYVGGEFSTVGGEARKNVAHILANDTVDPNFHPEVDGVVHELALSESGATLFIAGEFQTVAGQPRPGMAALETATGAATAFNPKPNGDSESCGMGVDGSYVFVCGGFSEIGGQPRTGRFAELNASDGSATSWNPEPAQYDSASALYLSPAKVLYLGYYGKFSEDTSGTQYEGVAALQIATEPEKPPTFLTSFHPNIGEVKGFYQLGETLYVGGRFNEVAFAPKDRETENYTVYERENLASFDIAKGYELLPFHPTPNGGEEYGNVGAITGGSGELYIAGYFGSVGGQPRTYLSELDPTTGEPLGSNPEIDGYVNAIAAAGSSVYVGGSFVTVHGAPRDHLAVINAGSGELEESDPGVDGTVDALATNGQTLYVGGEFRNAISSKEPSFESRNDLAAFSTATGKLTPFNPEPNGGVGALAISGQTLFAGGGFNKLHEVAHGTLAAFNTSTEALEAFNPEPNGGVSALSVNSGKLYAAGGFSKLEGLAGKPTRNDLAAFELPGETLDEAFAPPAFDGSVTALAANGSTVYAGGDFNNVGETYRPRLAALSAPEGKLEEWEPEVSNDVDSLLLDGSTLYAGGDFGDAGGQPRAGVAGLSTESGAATPFDPEAEGDVRALALAPNALYIGGTFTEVAGIDQSYFAAFDSGSLAEEEARGHTGGSGGEESSSNGTSGSSSEGSKAGSTPLGSESAGGGSVVPFAFPGPAPASPADVAPLLTNVKFPARIELGASKARATKSKRKRGRKARGKKPPASKAPAFTFTLSKAASVTITLQRIMHVSCRRHRGCTRIVAAGQITVHGNVGSDRAPFSGTVQGIHLLAGSYRATLVASDEAALSSKPVSVGFRLLGGGSSRPSPRARYRPRASTRR